MFAAPPPGAPAPPAGVSGLVVETGWSLAASAAAGSAAAALRSPVGTEGTDTPSTSDVTSGFSETGPTVPAVIGTPPRVAPEAPGCPLADSGSSDCPPA